MDWQFSTTNIPQKCGKGGFRPLPGSERCQAAARVMISTETYKKALLERCPNIKENVGFYNGYDPQLYERAAVENFNKFTILYSGIFYTDLNPRFFLKALGKWLNNSSSCNRKDGQVLFFGPFRRF